MWIVCCLAFRRQLGDETEDELDMNDEPDTPDDTHIPDEALQDVPGMFEDITLTQFQDTQGLDTQEPSSQIPDTPGPRFTGLQTFNPSSETPGSS